MDNPTLFDEARINVRGGKGGDGVVAFRREKFVPRGGPAGGDGGDGGSVVIAVDGRLNTLLHFRHQTLFAAARGGHGSGKNQTGARGEDIVVPVPPGTVVRDDDGTLLADLILPDQRVVVAQGGRGGRGNARFATSTHQAPRIAERGTPGEERWLRLELKLLADIGLVGLPNAGKSTLLSVVSAARPKIADYPFTTLQPNLGVVAVDDEYEFVLADLPGLIEGAHDGAGLGHRFLRHVERTRLLIHMLDGNSTNAWRDFELVTEELRLHNPQLADRPQIVAYNKIDLAEARAQWPAVEQAALAGGFTAYAISAVTGENVRQLMRHAGQLLHTLPVAPTHVEPEEIPVFRLDEKPVFTIRRADQMWVVEGAAVEQLVARTMWQYHDAAQRAQRQMEGMGLLEALRRAGVQPGDTVRIGDIQMEWLW